jgi:hypothetical protein
MVCAAWTRARADWVWYRFLSVTIPLFVTYRGRDEAVFGLVSGLGACLRL